MEDIPPPTACLLDAACTTTRGKDECIHRVVLAATIAARPLTAAAITNGASARRRREPTMTLEQSAASHVGSNDGAVTSSDKHDVRMSRAAVLGDTTDPRRIVARCRWNNRG